jgi:hypothetical protein
VATAETTYVEPSALARLYLHQYGSPEISAWCARAGGPILITHHGKIEITNSLCRAAFVKEIDGNALRKTLFNFDDDLLVGRFSIADILWRSALNRAAELSRSYTPTLGIRSLDVLHVACALELGRRFFLSFDAKQLELVRVVGLKPVRVL